MRYFYYLLIGMIVSFFGSSSIEAKNDPSLIDTKTLSGKVLDKATGLPLPGVSLYVPDLKSGTVSNDDGTFQLHDLPATKVVIQVSFTGYRSISEVIDLTGISNYDFLLEPAVAEIHEVVVTGLAQGTEKNRTPTPISTIPTLQLLQNGSSNIIDALSSQPGVAQISTGSGISKPVIRGLGYNRVVVVNDGIRQEGQQWGDEHGIEIDEFSVNKVEILKGPASLAYGSDAMAGVINMLSAPTLPRGSQKLNVLSNYQTNNGLIAYSANYAGNQKGLIWDVRYSQKMAHAYQNRYDGYVFNSAFRERAMSGILGLNKSWGYSHLHLSSYFLEPGMVEGERDSVSGKFIKQTVLNDSTTGTAMADAKDLRSYRLQTPYQQIHHYKAVWNSSFIIGQGSIKSTIGFQQNHRQEYGDVLNPKQHGLYFLLNTLNYDLRYVLPEKKGFSVTIGLNGMRQVAQNKGSEFLIPEYTLLDIGGFFIAKKTYGKLDLSGGLRYDIRQQAGKDLYVDANEVPSSPSDPSAVQLFKGFNSSYQGYSGSIGAAYQFSEKIYAKLNISKGFRAPSIAEIGANGVHEGTLNYIIGVPTLKPESSIQIDQAIGLNSEHVNAELALFRNQIDNYVYLRKLNSLSGDDSVLNGFPAFRYNSGQAVLTGGELSIDIHPHPLDWLHFENSFSMVNAVQTGQPDSMHYLPFTPSPRLSSELKVQQKKAGKRWANAYVKLGMDQYFAQNDVFSAYGTETATPAYRLWSMGMGVDYLRNKKTLCSIYISGSNLTDVAYQSHLNRLKYAPMNHQTGRSGVFNMGRNISIKVLIPIALRGK